MSNPKVKEMVQSKLQEGGFDGLWNREGECACKLDDLMPCGELDIHCCEAGYLQQAPTDSEYDFLIGEKKEVPSEPI